MPSGTARSVEFRISLEEGSCCASTMPCMLVDAMEWHASRSRIHPFIRSTTCPTCTALIFTPKTVKQPIFANGFLLRSLASTSTLLRAELENNGHEDGE